MCVCVCVAVAPHRWGDARKSRFADNEGDDTEVTQPANKRKSRYAPGFFSTFFRLGVDEK